MYQCGSLAADMALVKPAQSPHLLSRRARRERKTMSCALHNALPLPSHLLGLEREAGTPVRKCRESHRLYEVWYLWLWRNVLTRRRSQSLLLQHHASHLVHM